MFHWNLSFQAQPAPRGQPAPRVLLVVSTRVHQDLRATLAPMDLKGRKDPKAQRGPEESQGLTSTAAWKCQQLFSPWLSHMAFSPWQSKAKPFKQSRA